jgi:hypothetical protein
VERIGITVFAAAKRVANSWIPVKWMLPIRSSPASGSVSLGFRNATTCGRVRNLTRKCERNQASTDAVKDEAAEASTPQRLLITVPDFNLDGLRGTRSLDDAPTLNRSGASSQSVRPPQAPKEGADNDAIHHARGPL